MLTMFYVKRRRDKLCGLYLKKNWKELEATPLTTESLFDEFQPIVPVVIDFPDGSERLVKVRRINNAEAFSGVGVYAFIQDDGKIDESL